MPYFLVEGTRTVSNHIGARSLHYQKYTDDSLRLCFGHVSLRGAQIGIISGGNPKFVMQQIGVRGGEAS